MATQEDVSGHLDANPDASLKQIMEATGCSKPTAVDGRKAWRAANPEAVTPGNLEADDDEALPSAFPPKPAAQPVPKPTEADVQAARPKTYLWRL